ncbi:MAG: N-acetyltransferase [Chlamydiales bacterium]|nr:N-acetyltransferase [Chlamydiales bacterium]
MDENRDIIIRYTENEDAPFLKNWLEEPGVLRWFPMQDPLELEDAIKHWIGFSRYKCSLTAVDKGVPCGLSTLYLMPYRKVAHQCLFSIIVEKEHRRKGVGTLLLNNIIHLAKEQFRLDYLYLEVYEGNPAITLYDKFGFKEVGRQPHFIKEDGEYLGKIIMEKAI